MLEEDITPRGDSPKPAIISTADLYGRSNKGVDDVTQIDAKTDVESDGNVNPAGVSVAN